MRLHTHSLAQEWQGWFPSWSLSLPSIHPHHPESKRWTRSESTTTLRRSVPLLTPFNLHEEVRSMLWFFNTLFQPIRSRVSTILGQFFVTIPSEKMKMKKKKNKTKPLKLDVKVKKKKTSFITHTHTVGTVLLMYYYYICTPYPPTIRKVLLCKSTCFTHTQHKKWEMPWAFYPQWPGSVQKCHQLNSPP